MVLSRHRSHHRKITWHFSFIVFPATFLKSVHNWSLSCKNSFSQRWKKNLSSTVAIVLKVGGTNLSFFSKPSVHSFTISSLRLRMCQEVCYHIHTYIRTCIMQYSMIRWFIAWINQSSFFYHFDLLLNFPWPTAWLFSTEGTYNIAPVPLQFLIECPLSA